MFKLGRFHGERLLIQCLHSRAERKKLQIQCAGRPKSYRFNADLDHHSCKNYIFNVAGAAERIRCHAERWVTWNDGQEHPQIQKGWIW